jgi:predicted metal-dependent hydrolase
VYVRPGSTTEQRERVLLTWYRRELQVLIPPLIEKWTAILGVELAGWGIKRMKTRWGTCNIEARRSWLNLELIKKPAHCLEYIVVHEMVHLLERHHNERFTAHMDRVLPRWRFLRDELNRAPLGDERWDY